MSKCYKIKEEKQQIAGHRCEENKKRKNSATVVVEFKFYKHSEPVIKIEIK